LIWWSSCSRYLSNSKWRSLFSFTSRALSFLYGWADENVVDGFAFVEGGGWEDDDGGGF
jgi:hypothetical protein